MEPCLEKKEKSIYFGEVHGIMNRHGKRTDMRQRILLSKEARFN